LSAVQTIFYFMALTKTQKQKALSDLKDKIARQKALVLASISGVKVKDLARLRKEIKAQGGELKVAKKSLISLAFKEKKINIDAKKLEGEVVLGFGYSDEILPFRALFNFAKGNENLKILAGIIGQDVFTKEKAIELAQLASKTELLARAVASINAPVVNFVYVLQYNLKGLIYLFTKIKK
jgi:large subunit ribosomal protein L10